jgi:hypothetical protein
MSIRKSFALPALLALALLCLWATSSSASAAGANDTLLVRSANGSVAAGTEDVIGGKLLTSSGRPIRNGRVLIEYAYPGEHFKAVTEIKTSSIGSYYHLYTLPSTVYFRARFVGGGGFTPLTTSYVKVNVTRAVPADGSEYIDPKTGCAYIAEDGAWVGKYCETQQVDSSGRRIADMYNLYEFDAASSDHVGNYMMEEYTGDPQFLEYRIPDSIVFQTVSWAAFPKADPGTEPLWDTPVGGTWTWLTTAQLRELMNAQAAAAAGAQVAPPAVDTVEISGSYTAAMYQDFVNGIDNLGGNAALGAAASSVYSLGLSEPFTAGPCGEVNYECWDY